MAAVRRRRRRGDDGQHSAREGAQGLVSRVRSERRGDASRAGLSVAADGSRLRGKHQHQVAAPDRSVRRAVHDARGNVEVHGPLAERQSRAVLARDGSEVRHHVAVRRDDARRTGLPRNHGPCMAGARNAPAPRRFGRRGAAGAPGRAPASPRSPARLAALRSRPCGSPVPAPPTAGRG